ncbi:hypothetical protein EFQ80_16865 [Shigella sonnei]|nr:hypothetical protein [Shigella sonnei]EFX7678379.1 hypothetical protein [Shigella sonnei]
MNERLKTHSKTQKKSADLVSNKLRIGVFQRYQMKCKSVSKKSPRYKDSDVIKTYVALGLGIGLVAEQSSGEQEEENLIRLDTRHLFDANTVWLGLKRGQLQRNYVWRFLELCNAGLSVEDIKRQVMENSEEEIDYQI